MGLKRLSGLNQVSLLSQHFLQPVTPCSCSKSSSFTMYPFKFFKVFCDQIIINSKVF